MKGFVIAFRKDLKKKLKALYYMDGLSMDPLKKISKSFLLF